ncbi:MAG TPA: hypothetical protein VG122_18245 [Gemmata sp.]|jgi:hypothetical protein|nr:hypothetical protein [Gemmata sp.]
MRVIEQLVQHFWTRGALTRDEAAYLVQHGFVREDDLAGFVESPHGTDAEEFENLRDNPRFDPADLHAEELEDELTGRKAGGGKKGEKKKKPAGHNLAPAAAHIAAHIAMREPYHALHDLGCRLGPCGTWRDAARRIAATTSIDLEMAMIGLLISHPRSLGELWFWFDLEPLFVWTESVDNAGPVAEGIGKLLRADTLNRVGRLDQLKKAPEIQALIELLAARRQFLTLLPALYNRHFDKLGLWLIPPAGVALVSWPSLPWAFVIVYNARNGTVDEPPSGYLLPLDHVPWRVIQDALRTAFPIDPQAIRELLLHHIRERPDAMPDQSDLWRNMVFDRPLYCPYTWKV